MNLFKNRLRTGDETDNREPDPSEGWTQTTQQTGYSTTGSQIEALTRAGQAVEYSRNQTTGTAMRQYAFDKQDFQMKMKLLEKEIDERGSKIQKNALEIHKKNEEQLKKKEQEKQAAADAAKKGPQPSAN